MIRVDELMLRHTELKAKIAARDADKKQRKAEFDAQLKDELEGVWGKDLDAELEKVREDLKIIAAQEPDQMYVGEVGQLLLEDRQLSWEVFDLGSFAKWVVAEGRADDLLDVQKGNVNRLCDGLQMAKFSIPFGVRPKMTTVLEVKSAGLGSVESQ